LHFPQPSGTLFLAEAPTSQTEQTQTIKQQTNDAVNVYTTTQQQHNNNNNTTTTTTTTTTTRRKTGRKSKRKLFKKAGE
jgi:hypothetical protein